MTERIVSFDMDGCLFNRSYHHSSEKNVVHHNQALLDKINADVYPYEKTTAFIGSLRQSKQLDDLGIEQNNTESCFSAIKQIAAYLNATFCPLLMSDIFEDVSEGDSYLQATTLKAKLKHPICVADTSKLTLLYAQMHHMATQNPTTQFDFDFYDDLGADAEEDLMLEELAYFFNKYPEFIPSNMILRLNHYAGEAVKSYCPIQGTGNIDTNYRQTVIDMIEVPPPLTIKSPPYGNRNCVAYITPNELQAQQQRRDSLIQSQQQSNGLTIKSNRLQRELKALSDHAQMCAFAKSVKQTPKLVSSNVASKSKIAVAENPFSFHYTNPHPLQRRKSFFGKAELLEMTSANKSTPNEPSV